MNRRDWLRATTAAALALGPPSLARADDVPTPAKLPKWRGFNLLSMFMANPGVEPGFPEADFDMVKALGFDFVRLPLDYRFWVDPNDWMKVREDVAAKVDEAVDFGRARKIHVQVNFHRAPGYTVASPKEARSLWADADALDACSAHWTHFARRYKGRPNSEVSFNLLNEPNQRVTAGEHRRVIERLVGAIREVDPERLIVCDGRGFARIPPTELIGLNVAASAHNYDPHRLTHYRASWVEASSTWPTPKWPMSEDDRKRDREWLVEHAITPWKEFEAKGVGIHIGEFGCHNQTPHDVVLAWMRDVLDLIRGAGWGWALWNLRGSFGILDSQRADVAYEDYHGHKLDRAMLELLKEFSA